MERGEEFGTTLVGESDIDSELDVDTREVRASGPAAGARARPRRTRVGELLADRYRLIERLGAGGMGTVYRAEHVALGKFVAIKLLDERAATTTATERFISEARATARIHHPNIVEITDFGVCPRQLPFFAMELIAGEDLRKTLDREGALAWPRVRSMLLQILAALEAAHASGVIHRDIKPSNCIRVDRPGHPDFIKVVDFGLAKVITDDPRHESLTTKGTVMGTVHYMSLEQARGERLDPRTDVYSAGVLAFELLTGRQPYTGGGSLAVLAKILTDEVPTLSQVAPERRFAAQLERTIARAMAKHRDERFPSAAAFAAAIRAIPAQAPRVVRRGGWAAPAVGLGLLALACGAIAGSLWVRASPDSSEAPGDQAPASTELPVAPAGAVIPWHRSVEPAADAVTPPTPASVGANPPVSKPGKSGARARTEREARTASIKIGVELGQSPAQVFVDGEPAGATPVEVAVAPGIHALRWVWDDGWTSGQTVDVFDGPAIIVKARRTEAPLSASAEAEVQFVANEFFFVYVSVGDADLVVEPTAMTRLAPGKYPVYLRTSEDDEWQLAGTLAVERGRSYRVEMTKPAGLRIIAAAP